MVTRRLSAVALVTCIGSVPTLADTRPDVNTLMTLELVAMDHGGDAVHGNYESRLDRISNLSAEFRIRLDGVASIKLLNPEDLGVADLEPGNALEVQALAESLFPDYPFWRTCFWQFAFPAAELDVPPVHWVSAEFPRAGFPITLEPGESFLLKTVAHNDIMGPANPAPEEIGELVIGWKFDGSAIPTSCGDSLLESRFEMCDDGNSVNTDRCRNDCTTPTCGDGIVDPQTGESCDGATPSGSTVGGACRGDCTRCGDGQADPGSDGNWAPLVDIAREACDDGNGIDDDNCTNSCTQPRPPDEGHVISSAADGASAVFAIHVDDDPHMDVLSAAFFGDTVVWYKNDPGRKHWIERTVTTVADGVSSLFAADLDNDGDPDVVTASANDNRIAWHENLSGDGVDWATHIVSEGAMGASSVFVADLNGDDRLDVLSASFDDDRIAWHENALDRDGAWQRHTIGDADGARCVCAADLDGDDDPDVLAASHNDGIVWYENDGHSPPGWTARIITTAALGLESIDAADVNDDDWVDVLSASATDNAIDWFENPGAQKSRGRSSEWTRHSVTRAVLLPVSISAADVDGDNDIDVLSASHGDDTIAFLENDGHRPPGWTHRVISRVAAGASAVLAADLDGDGDSDAITASAADDTIAWYEYQGGFPEPCGNGDLDRGEQCDDGNSDGGDGCRADCTLEVCGDGIQDPTEACDDGNKVDGDGCNSDCTHGECGDGFLDAGEECDDGNQSDGDCCAADCIFEPAESACDDDVFCTATDVCDGAGTCEGSGETDCDDGDICTDDSCDRATDACLNVEDTTNDPTCEPVECGNGVLDAGETCDPPGGACQDDCTICVDDDLCPPPFPVAEGTRMVGEGTGMMAPPGTIDVEIPRAAVVRQVLLYWNGFHVTAAGDDGVTLNGDHAVAGTLIGGPTRFFGSTLSSTYRADITGLRLIDDGPSQNTVTVADLDFDRGGGPGSGANGASIIAIIDEESPRADIRFYEGQDLAYADFAPPLETTSRKTFKVSVAAEARPARLTLIVGSAQGSDWGSDPIRPSLVRVTIGDIETEILDPFTGDCGAEWDHFETVIEIPAGVSTVTVQALSDAHGTGRRPASFVLVFAGLWVPAAAPPPAAGNRLRASSP